MTDAELMALDATKEIERLKTVLGPKDVMYPWIAPLAIRRMVADEQFRKCQGQVIPQPERGEWMTPNPVAPSLKERFSEWIDRRTEKGIDTYGTPLMTFNGRGTEQDALDEILDFCQYREQHIRELEAKLKAHGISWPGEKFDGNNQVQK